MRKRIIMILMAAVASAFAGCSDPVVIPEKPVKVIPDEVSVFPEQETFDQEGGTIDVVVTSSDKWSLSGEYDWVTVSAMSGKDGDKITFTVAPNNTDEERHAEFTLTVGKVTKTFELISEAKKENDPEKEELTGIELLTGDQMQLGTEAQRIEIKLNTNFNHRKLNVSLSDPDAVWLKFLLPTRIDDEVTLFFDVAANTAFESRSVVVTITGGDATADVTVSQAQTDRLEPDNSAYFIAANGGYVDVQLIANVKYIVKINDEAAGWLSHTDKSNDLHRFSASGFSGKRDATVTFSSENGSIVKTVSITQKNEAIISKAAHMGGNKAWPWWHNNAPVENLSSFSMEALIYADEWKQIGEINVIMGIEGTFIIRTGDIMKPNNMLQVYYKSTPSDGFGPKVESRLELPGILKTHKWYHIAVTHERDANTIKVYIDGVLSATGKQYKESAAYRLMTYNFGVEFTDEDYKDAPRCFWVGSSIESSESWPGMMSEVRIWNRVLSEEEINSSNHFYKVDPNSPGLVAYWKMDDGSDITDFGAIKDYSPYGNPLAVKKPVNWQSVSLP